MPRLLPAHSQAGPAQRSAVYSVSSSVRSRWCQHNRKLLLNTSLLHCRCRAVREARRSAVCFGRWGSLAAPAQGWDVRDRSSSFPAPPHPSRYAGITTPCICFGHSSSLGRRLALFSTFEQLSPSPCFRASFREQPQNRLKTSRLGQQHCATKAAAVAARSAASPCPRAARS